MAIMDWHDGGAVAGFIAALATVFGFGLSRTDKAQEQRDRRTRDIARSVYDEESERVNADVRINTIEVILPRIERKIDDTADLVRSTSDTFNQLLASGTLHIRKRDNE